MKLTLKQLKQMIKEEAELAKKSPKRESKSKQGNRLDERSAGEVMNALRTTLNTCSNHVSDVFTFVKTKRPDWQDVLKSLKEAENSIERALQGILDKKG